MKTLTTATIAFLLILMIGCSNTAESPFSMMERSQSMALPESPPAESDSEPTPQSDSLSTSEITSQSSSPTPSATAVPTATPKPTATAVPTATPKPTATAAPTVTPKPTATAAPTAQPASTSKAENSGEAQYKLSSNTVKAGNYLTLTCTNPPPLDELSLKVSLNGVFQLMENDDEIISLIGISRNIAPGSYKAVVSQNGTEVAVLPFTVADGGFQREEFQMAESVTSSTVNSNTARDEYNRITASVMAASTATKNLPAFDSFIMPINPPTFKISSSYGFTRVVNGKVSGRHEGVDFPAPKGTPVVAANDGKVLYAGLMQMTGNTVVIEHGMGLKSWYQHLDSLSCATGDTLSAGDPVGAVGTTGYSTGNHLHFGMSINDTYTNPWQFIPMP